MANSCTPGTGFPTATQMDFLATNHGVVWEEICELQQAILAAASQCQVGGGKMCTTVGGSTPMTFVSGVNSITVLTPGAGYLRDTPSVEFIPPFGSTGNGATGTVTTNGGNILLVEVTNGGSGYQPIPTTLSVTSLTGTGAILQPLVNAAGQIIAVNILNSGANYTLTDSVTPVRALAMESTFVTATFKILGVGDAGEILSVAVLEVGSGYEDSVTTIKLVSSLTSSLPYPLGTGFVSAVMTDVAGSVTYVSIINSGAGYSTYDPYLAIIDIGTGATTQVILDLDTVSAINVIKQGYNYTQAATGTVFNPPTAPLPNPPTAPASIVVNVGNNTFGTDPALYWRVWYGATTDKQISTQLNSVITYFTGLGYTISLQTNPTTGQTLQWRICW